jgi:hypothetical protein
MFDSSQFADIPRIAKKQAWMCLLLSLLFLYNPYLAVQGPSGALSVGHRPSYRATVAASELSRFENPENREGIAIANLDVFEAFILLQPRSQTFAGHGNTEVLPPVDQFLSGNLWFRPPPSA